MRVEAQLVGVVEYPVVGVGVGPEEAIYVLQSSGRLASGFRISCFGDEWNWDCVIEESLTGLHLVQPLPNGFLLAHCRQSGSLDNARVYDADGKFVRGLNLGDGINDIQATSSGAIWVSYFDEGVFGSGIGAAGLVRFDDQGNPLYRFQPTAEIDWICDCYALNVESDDTVWLCYYTEFPLVRLRNGVVDGVWQPGIRGANAFAIRANRVVIHAGYGANDWRVLDLDVSGVVIAFESVEFLNEHKIPIPAKCAYSRGRLIWFVEGSKVYRVDTTQIR